MTGLFKSLILKFFNHYNYDILSTKYIDKKFNFYKNKHEGQRCVIIGNGPSLNQTNLTLLENEITFGLNKIFLLFPRLTFCPTYLISCIPDVVSQCKEEFQKLNIPLFVSNKSKEILKDRKYETHYFGKQKQFIFSLNPAKEICVGHTVTYVALQLAFFMGFKKVILIGVDHSFNYEGPSDTWHLVEKEVKGRHFVDNYFSVGQTWQSPNLKMAEAHYALAKSVYEFYNRNIINSTIESKLDVFEKIPLEQALCET